MFIQFGQGLAGMTSLQSDSIVEVRMRLAGRAKKPIPKTVQLDTSARRHHVKGIAALVASRIGGAEQRGAVQRLMNIANEVDQPGQMNSTSLGRSFRVRDDLLALLDAEKHIVTG